MKKAIISIMILFSLFSTGCSSSEIDKYIEKSTYKYDLENITKIDNSQNLFEITGTPEGNNTKNSIWQGIVYNDKNKIKDIYLQYIPENDNVFTNVKYFEEELNVLCNYISSDFDKEVIDDINKLVRNYIINKNLPYSFKPSAAESKMSESDSSSLDKIYYTNVIENNNETILVKLTLVEKGGMNILVKYK